MNETQDRNICKLCGGLIQVEYTITFQYCVPHEMHVEPTGLSPFRLCPGHEVGHTIGVTDTRNWEQLSAEQKHAADQLRKRISDSLIEQSEAFQEEHPELRLTWSCSLDALLRSEHDILYQEL